MIFKTHSNIYKAAFCEKSYWCELFTQKTLSQTFDMVVASFITAKTNILGNASQKVFKKKKKKKKTLKKNVYYCFLDFLVLTKDWFPCKISNFYWNEKDTITLNQSFLLLDNHLFNQL